MSYFTIKVNTMQYLNLLAAEFTFVYWHFPDFTAINNRI